MKKILKTEIFEEINYLFYDKKKNIFKEKIFEEIIDKKIYFYTLNIFSSGNTDKFSLNIYINSIPNFFAPLKFLTNKESICYHNVLKIGKIINVLIHELNHCTLVIYNFISNGEKGIFTPDRNYLKGKFKEIKGKEGGEHIEQILFGRIINKLNLGESLYILNYENYEKKTVEQFRNDFMNLNNLKDLNIKGEFQSFMTEINFNKENIYSHLKEISISKDSNNEIYIDIIKTERCTLP